MMPHSPFYANNRDGDWAKEDMRGATEAMLAVIRKFETDYNCVVTCDEVQDISKISETYCSRYHFIVAHKPV